MARRQSVVVIGGGVAGLAAAGALSRAGIVITLLEARGRLGGRVDTQSGFADVPLERGAEFVHGRSPPLLKALKKAGAHLQAVSFDPLLLSGGREQKLGRAFGRVFAELGRAPAEDVAFGERLRQWEPEAAQLGRQYVEGYMAAEADRVSSQALAQEQRAADEISGDVSAFVREGYGRLIAGLAKELPTESIHRSRVVQSVEWEAGRVRVTCLGPGGHALPPIEATRAIVTIPLGLWQADAIHFFPRLDQQLSAARRLGSGRVVKLFLRLRAPLHEAPGLSRPLRSRLRRAEFVLIPHGAVPTWWRRGSLWIGWAGGPAALPLSEGGEAYAIQVAIAALAGALGIAEAALASIVEATHLADWQHDPFARGAYSWVPVGALDAPAQLATPCAETLFFAGEATDTVGHRGTVHAALETGLRAAREVRDVIG